MQFILEDKKVSVPLAVFAKTKSIVVQYQLHGCRTVIVNSIKKSVVLRKHEKLKIATINHTTMKTATLLSALVSLLSISCSTETYFDIGISMPSRLSLRAKKTLEAAKDGNGYDVIIVPGYPYNPKSMSSILKVRILWAKYLYDSGLTKNIIFSGSSVYSPYTEGEVMKKMAVALGIPADHIFVEAAAEHSTENVYYSWKIAKKMKFKSIALATDPFQSAMLNNFIRTYCSDIKSLPVVYDKLKTHQTIIPPIDASSAYVFDFVSLAHRESYRQRFAGTRGRRVRKELEAERIASVQLLQQMDLIK